MRSLALAIAATCVLTACSSPAALAPPAAETPPAVGRYQFIGKEKYDDGSVEYACLDTATGEIGYATIYPDADTARRALTNFDCSD